MSQENRAALLRILDANANRAAEGMRVVEEYARFVLDDAHLTRLLKQLRHDLVEILRVLPREELCAARATEQDVGTQAATQAEYARQNVRDVVVANQKRVEQSLRSLEEFLKPLSVDAARGIEQLRYRAYTLGRAVELTDISRQRLQQATLYVLIDGGESLEVFSQAVAALVRAEVHILQLRDSRLNDKQLVARGRRLRELTRETATLFVMNNRPDLAVLTQADGVHVGQDDLSVKEVRAIAGPQALVGVSTHSLPQARQAVLDGANYLGCGPTFPSPTKSFAEFPGLEFLRTVSSEISLPAFAIGGISLANLSDAQATGFSRVAVASAVTGSKDPERTAKRFTESLNLQVTRFLRILLVVMLLKGGVSAEDGVPAIVDVIYGAPQQLATLANQKINESSGLAASRVEPGLFWTHNDSGDAARVFAFDAAGRHRGEFELPKTKAIDWEDMASVSIDGKPYLIVADVGDNARRRESCVLRVITEPSSPKPSSSKSSSSVRTIRFRYQDGPRDCEAVAIDPLSKQVFLVTKAFAIRCPIYQLAWPDRDSDDVLVAQRIGSVQLPMVTAMDISADGRRAIMLTYADAYEFQRRGKESWRDALARSPRRIAMPRRRQGETICYGHDGRTLYLTSERTPTPLWRVAPQVAP